MTYVQRIRDLREDMDITQEEVAKILNTTQGYYSKYELGIRKLPIDHLTRRKEEDDYDLCSKNKRFKRRYGYNAGRSSENS